MEDQLFCNQAAGMEIESILMSDGGELEVGGGLSRMSIVPVAGSGGWTFWIEAIGKKTVLINPLHVVAITYAD